MYRPQGRGLKARIQLPENVFLILVAAISSLAGFQLPNHFCDFGMLQIIIRHLIQRCPRPCRAAHGGPGCGAGQRCEGSGEVAGDAGFLQLFGHGRRGERGVCVRQESCEVQARGAADRRVADVVGRWGTMHLNFNPEFPFPRETARSGNQVQSNTCLRTQSRRLHQNCLLLPFLGRYREH